MSQIIDLNVKIRFYKYGDIIGEENKCWIWRGPINNNGYGRFSVDKIDHYAHIVAYAIKHKLNKVDLYVCHTCDNKLCVNHNHLFLGTHLDNMKDKISKGRQTKKLTDKEVIEIREKYEHGIYTQRKLAGEYNVCQYTIRVIVNNLAWKHLL